MQQQQNVFMENSDIAVTQPEENQKSFSRIQNQSQQDLQLLIRAHEKIRQLEEENLRLNEQKMNIFYQLKEEKEKSTILSQENIKLKRLSDELLQRIVQLEKQLGKKPSWITVQTVAKEESHKVFQSSRKSSTDAQGTLQENLAALQKSNRFKQPTQRSLKPSESTPVILNINVNAISKEDRQQFLSSCKQQFAQQLQKFTEKESSNIRTLQRNRSQQLILDSEQKINHNPFSYGTASFLKEAQRQFDNLNDRTLKNNLYVDRRKSASSGSLIKKNIGRISDTSLLKDSLQDRTNYVNSKYASVNQILANSAPKSPYISNAYPNNIRIGYPNDYSSSHKFINGEYSRNVYCSRDKRSDLKDRRKKEFQMQLRNQANNGFIKYRGLCL